MLWTSAMTNILDEYFLIHYVDASNLRWSPLIATSKSTFQLTTYLTLWTTSSSSELFIWTPKTIFSWSSSLFFLAAQSPWSFFSIPRHPGQLSLLPMLTLSTPMAYNSSFLNFHCVQSVTTIFCHFHKSHVFYFLSISFYWAHLA